MYDKTEGIVILHVDDFLAMGSTLFFNNVMKKIKLTFKFGKIEKNMFRFCGLDIKVTDSGITLSQNEYIVTLHLTLQYSFNVLLSF